LPEIGGNPFPKVSNKKCNGCFDASASPLLWAEGVGALGGERRLQGNHRKPPELWWRIEQMSIDKDWSPAQIAGVPRKHIRTATGSQRNPFRGLGDGHHR